MIAGPIVTIMMMMEIIMEGTLMVEMISTAGLIQFLSDAFPLMSCIFVLSHPPLT